MVKIRRYLAPLTRTSGRGNPCKYITIHETANRGRGANANAHARLQAGTNSRMASWHYQVDDREIVQSFDDNVRCWHAGATANNESIAIEICVNSDGNYDRAVANAAALVAHLRRKHNIPWSRVVSHNFWTGKNCPTIMLSQRGRWDRFIAATNPNNTTTPSTPSRPPATTTPSTPGPTQAEERKSWLEMVSKNELQSLLRQEGWAYKGSNETRDAYSYLRATLRAAERLEKALDRVDVQVWGYKGRNETSDAYAYLRATRREVAAIKGENEGLLKALEQAGSVNVDEVRKAAREGVEKALKSIEADVTLNVETSEGE